jgi:serine/threonine-protein kinase RsbW
MEASKDAGAWQRLTLRASSEVSACVTHLVDALETFAYAERDLFGVRLALEEALVNAIKHGHRHDTSKTVYVRFQATTTEFLIEIEDEGPGFDPEGIPDPLAPENLERPGGRGVFLMRHYMTWVSYNETGNCVTMCKRRSP